MGWRSASIAASTASLVLLVAASFAPAQAFGAYKDIVLADNPNSYFRLDDADATMINETAQPDGAHVDNPVLGLPGALTSETPNLGISYGSGTDRSDFSVTSYDEFSIEFFVITTQASLPDTADQWFKGYGLVDGEVSGVSNDAGVALVRHGRVGFGVGNPDITLESTSAVNDGDWHHVVATNDGAGTLKIYVDGVQENSVTGASSAARTNPGFQIGSILTPLGTNGQLEGGMDEVAFYDDALDAATVAEHANAGLANVDVRFSISGNRGGRLTGPGIDCRETGTIGCANNEPLGAIRDYTAVPDPGYRLGNFSFLGDCVAISVNQCRVTVDKPGGESSLITFHPQPAVSAEQIRQLLASVATAISNSLGASLGGGGGRKNPPKPPAQLVLPPKVPPGVGELGAVVAGSFKNIKGKPVPVTSPPGKVVELAKGALIGSDGATMLSDGGGGLIGSDGATLIGSDGATRRGALPLAATAKKKKKKKAKAKTIVLASYVMPTDGSSVQPVLKLTAAGRKTLAKIGALNSRRKKKIVPNVAYLEVFQPQDNSGSGGALTNVRLK